jgi:xylulose-5-phosphate/fructose-6-phosphate phosphoketolase
LVYTIPMTYKVPANSSTWLANHHRLTNFIGASALYLQDNYDLKKQLDPSHIKPRILGHWGTVPGINLIYGGLDVLIKETGQETMLITGPGHGAPTVLANLFVEGTLSEFYPNISHDLKGMSELIHDFSWPKKFPSHTYPGLPGSIHEGGELGYSLGTAFGAAFNNPDLMVACIVGDGEAETGALAASWHSNKFLNPKTDGVVLPILHVNGYKISNPTIFGTMSREENEQYFKGLGYDPIWVSQYESEDIYTDWLETLFTAYNKIKAIKENWKEGQKAHWPVIILKTKKGWTGPAEINGEKLEDNNLSHGIPLKNPKTDKHELETLETWLRSYNINEFFDDKGDLVSSVDSQIPEKQFRIGKNRHTYGGSEKELVLPDADMYTVSVDMRGMSPASELGSMSKMLERILELNKDTFRVFSPDESESNKLDALFKASSRVYEWPLREHDKNFATQGQIMEILSEQTLQSWMQGYNMTGRNGILVSYEAFLSIIASQIDQYMKFLHQTLEFEWRKPVPSMSYIATSSVWRQDHNGFTHQNPILINTLLAKQVDFVSVYFPTDVNTMIYTLQKSLSDKNQVNLIVAGKTDLPQWLTPEEAKEHVENGLSTWTWVSGEYNTQNPDVVLSSAGDYQTLETLAAIDLLRDFCPELKVRFVSINELTCLGFGENHKKNIATVELTDYFTTDRQVIFNFHGYPEAIKQLVCGHEISMRMKILGYIEKGSTTTPFDMQIRNLTSRYHVAIEAIKAAAKVNSKIQESQKELLAHFAGKIAEHEEYIVEHGEDLPEIQNWVWKSK